MKKILVIGSGGREHAICEKFLESQEYTKIYALPGNAGTDEIAENISDIKANEHDKIIDFCKKEQIDFVFVGPEQPLVDGIIDDLQEAGIKAFGPSKAASKLEGSKIFMKEIISKNKIPTAIYQDFTNEKDALEFVKTMSMPCVIKTDGLAAGKGVIIAQNLEEAQENISEIFSGKFGNAGNKILIEEFLTGFEASYFVICDGENFIPLGFAHDHKKVGENDSGLNTGGMGTYTPSPLIDKKLEEKIIKTIIKPTIQGMKNEGTPFKGILFAGLMIDNNKPKLLEFNIRFGDPETQIILPRIKADFNNLIEAAINGNLDQFEIKFDEKEKLVCVVMCTKGYPGSYKKGSEIKNLDKIKIPGVKILHAGTKKEKGKILANGGRVLNIIASATSFKEARENAYKAVELIDWHDGFVRKDIALKAI